MEARSGQNHDNIIALQVNFNPTEANIMDLLHILSSINNTFFSMLLIIFSNTGYFCFNYTNTFFIHTMNYFSVVLRIIFLMCIEKKVLFSDDKNTQHVHNICCSCIKIDLRCNFIAMILTRTGLHKEVLSFCKRNGERRLGHI